MTKEQLLKHTAHEIKKDKVLYAVFLKEYKKENGENAGCSSCAFRSVINRWKQQINIKTMSTKKTVKGTFKLLNELAIIRIPFTTKVIDKNSSDKDVKAFLKLDETNARFFRELPKDAKQVKAEADKLKAEKEAQDKAEAKRLEAEKKATEKAEADKLKAEKEAQDKAEAKSLEAEKKATESRLADKESGKKQQDKAKAKKKKQQKKNKLWQILKNLTVVP